MKSTLVLNDLEIKEKIHESESSVIFRCSHKGNQKELIYKKSNQANDAHILNEFQLLQEFAEPNGDFALLGHALVRPYYEGVSLKELILSGNKGCIFFFQYAKSLVIALNRIHQQSIIHKDLTPLNIIVNSKDNSTAIIDFDSGTKLKSVHESVSPESKFAGHLFYVSPEQTGRMNRSLDYRSDYYSLGVGFYEMLSGKCPFVGIDPLELIHSHIARKPTSLHEIDKSIPLSLANFVAKLMEKNPEDRYQSGIGILSDLDRCEQYWKEKNSMPFELGLRDVPARLYVSQIMVGREEPLKVLFDTFEECVGGAKKLLRVSGLSGMGKTLFVKEALKPVTAGRGYFIHSKFEALNKNIPYSGWKSGIEQLAASLLSETPAVLEMRRKEILAGMQGLAGILTRYSEKWHKVLGEQPELPDLGGIEQQNRFLYAINLFLQTLATSKHPLLIFIDDWQWADLASIKLLQSILSEPANTHLLMVAAFRHNETPPNHPFSLACLEIADETNDGIETIHLEALKEADCKEILRQTFHQSHQDLSELSSLIHSKTLGNAFLIHQFLTWMYDRKILWLHAENACWQWDAEKIRLAATGENLVEIILERLRALPKATQEALQAASVAGNTFSLQMLAGILDQQEASVHEQLWSAVTENIILPLQADYKYLPEYWAEKNKDVQFRFAHDRLQQALYDHIGNERLQDLHFRSARHYIQMGIGDDNLFSASKHFLLAKDKMKDADFKHQAALILEKAGIRSSRNAAFATAFEYLEVAFDLLGTTYQPETDSVVSYVESAYLSGKQDKAQSRIQRQIEQTPELLDRSRIYEMLIRSHTSLGSFAEAITYSQKALAELEVKIPAKAGLLKIILEAIKTRSKFPDKHLDKIAELPVMTNPKGMQIMRIMNASLPAYFLSSHPVYPLLLFEGIRVSQKYGNADESAAIYSSYGIILSGIFNAKNSAFVAGKQSLLLAQNEENGRMLGQVGFTDNMFLMYLKEPYTESLSRSMSYHRSALAAGNMEYAGWNLFVHAFVQTNLGSNLQNLYAEFETLVDFLRRFNLNGHYRKAILSQELNKHLYQNTSEQLILVDPDYDETYLAEEISKNDKVSLFTYYFNRSLVAFLYEDTTHAETELRKSMKFFKDAISLFTQPLSKFLEALIANEQNQKYSKQAKQTTKLLAGFMKMQQSNFEWMHRTLAAEKDFYHTGKPDEKIYREASSLARIGGFGWPSAMPLLVLFRHQLRLNQTEEAKQTAKELTSTLSEFSALGLLNYYEKKYPVYFAKSKQPAPSMSSTSVIEGSSFDSMTLIKSTEALTGEMEIGRLIDKLIHFAMENAGASEGIFLLPDEKGGYEPMLQMSAEGKASKPEHHAALIPLSVLNYAIQTREPLILENALQTDPYGDDPMIKKQGLRSLLCIPFVHQNNIAGIIYLTHQSLAGVFTYERVALLRMLAGQVAVSLENARMYTNMENLVAQRTRQLEEEKQKSDELLRNILPEEVAEELKKFGKAKPRLFPNSTVMFCDMVNFTEVAAGMTPENLVSELDDYFQAFDRITEKHGVEKIKTIGDAYMAVAGVPSEQANHAEQMAKAALEVQAYLQEKKRAQNGVGFDMRMGLHSGAVVAGIVGAKKFQYDIWGDTVNTASRMESTGEPGQINVSDSTYQLLQADFELKERGLVFVKGKGEVKTWYLIGEKKK